MASENESPEPERSITLDETWAERYSEHPGSIEDILNHFEQDIDNEARVREPQIEQHNLKDMDVEDLLDNLLELGSSWDNEERSMVADAYKLAADLHKDDRHRDKPYTYHLLRNANRAASYLHITDPEIITAIILHDSVEDHADGIVASAGELGNPVSHSPGEERAEAYTVLQNKFSPRVSRIVEGMSNPLNPEGLVLGQGEKISRYIEHVVDAIADKDVWIAKVVDWGDNGLGLVHSDLDTTIGRGAKLMRKYRGVARALEERFHKDDIQTMLDPIAKLNLEHMFELGRERLSTDLAA